MRKAVIILAFAVIGWAWCGAIVGFGRRVFSMETTLILHAVGGPLGFALLSWIYHRKFALTRPLETAITFLFIVMALDVFVVAMVLERSFAMFHSVLGTWLPFLLIFVATYGVGRLALRAPTDRLSR